MNIDEEIPLFHSQQSPPACNGIDEITQTLANGFFPILATYAPPALPPIRPFDILWQEFMGNNDDYDDAASYKPDEHFCFLKFSFLIRYADIIVTSFPGPILPVYLLGQLMMTVVKASLKEKRLQIITIDFDSTQLKLMLPRWNSRQSMLLFFDFTGLTAITTKQQQLTVSHCSIWRRIDHTGEWILGFVRIRFKLNKKTRFFAVPSWVSIEFAMAVIWNLTKIRPITFNGAFIDNPKQLISLQGVACIACLMGGIRDTVTPCIQPPPCSCGSHLPTFK